MIKKSVTVFPWWTPCDSHVLIRLSVSQAFRKISKSWVNPTWSAFSVMISLYFYVFFNNMTYSDLIQALNPWQDVSVPEESGCFSCSAFYCFSATRLAGEVALFTMLSALSVLSFFGLDELPPLYSWQKYSQSLIEKISITIKITSIFIWSVIWWPCL